MSDINVMTSILPYYVFLTLFPLYVDKYKSQYKKGNQHDVRHILIKSSEEGSFLTRVIFLPPPIVCSALPSQNKVMSLSDG